MIEIKKAHLVYAAAACLAVGYWLSTYHAAPAPVDRPVLRFLAHLAKTGLWLMIFAEPNPTPQSTYKLALIGEDGFPRVNHAEAF